MSSILNSKKIKELRQKAQFDEDMLANLTGTSINWILFIETENHPDHNDQVTIGDLEKLALNLNCKPHELIKNA